MKKIAVLIDFTSICEIAIAHAAVVARYTLTPLLLVNIAPKGSERDEKEIKERMKQHARYLDDENIPFALGVGYGEFFSTIPQYLTQQGVDFVVVATHGIKGIADASYGLNILRLIRGMQIPSLVVQGHSQAPLEGYDQVLLPILLKHSTISQCPQIVEFANYFTSQITLLHYMRDELGLEDANRLYVKKFVGVSKPVVYDYEVVSAYVHSFNRSILQYAEIEDINLLVLAENRGEQVLDNDDQENLILNRQGIAVLYLP